MTHRLPFLLTLTLALFLPNGVHGQRPPIGAIAQVRASVGGTVRDESGAVLPGVRVTLTEESTPNAASRTTTTDAEGGFRFGDLAPGAYRIEAVLTGFVRTIRRGVLVASAQANSLTLIMRSGAPPPPPPPPIPSPSPTPTTSSTSTTTTTVPAPPVPPPTKRPDAGLAVIPVFYATDRAQTGSSPLDYGSGRSPSGT